MNTPLMPPKAKVQPETRTQHGYTWTDDYAWLRSAKWQDVMRDPSLLEPDIRAYLEAENAYTDSVLRDTQILQETLFQEYRGRIREDESSVPEDEGPWSYYSRYVTGGQHPIVCRKPRGSDGPEQVLFDGDEAAQGKGYFEVGGCETSPSHNLLGVATDDSGAELWTLRFKNLENEYWLPDLIEGTSGSFVFLDNQTVFYTVLDESHRPRTVKRHILGTEPSVDTVVYHEDDPGFFVTLGMSESQRYVVIDSHDHMTSETRLIAVQSADRTPQLVRKRRQGVEYQVSDHGTKLLILTNAEGAQDFAVQQMPLNELGKDIDGVSWTDLIPHQAGRLILEYHVFLKYLVVLERIDSLPRLMVYEFTEEGVNEGHAIAFEEEAYSLSLLGSREFRTSVVRFGYSSMSTPYQVFDYEMDTQTRVLRKTQEVPSGHDPKTYRSCRIMVKSHDGEDVPVSILYHRDTPIDGSAPLLLYGYGSYGMSMPASFSVTRLSLVDRGFVYAIAHIRGGKERGYRWYQHGKLAHKMNTFLDFIAAAEGLVAAKFADPKRVTAQGGSAGGMLMGVVANLRPDLFQAIVADVPFVDVLNTMLDDTLPLTPPEWPEWGNPLTDASAFTRIKGYSPYDNVSTQSYPHMLVLAGLTDPRVTYWEPAKWVAKLRDRKQDDQMLVFKTHMEAGHGGASGRFDALKEVALEQAFLLKSVGRD